ncbi:MAG: hypothetical protein V4666_12505 [Bacteroidota bacterium]
MRNLFKIGIVFIILILSCKTKISNTDYNFSEADTAMLAVVDSVDFEDVKKEEGIEEKSINIDSVLSLNVNIDKELTSDSIYNAIGPVGEQQLDNGQVIAFTRIEKGGDVFAFVCPDIYTYDSETVKIDFYKLKDKKWNYLNSSEVDDVVYFKSVDLDNDGVFEIQSVGHFNMNGNCSNYFFEYSKLENKIYNGGGFFSSLYEFKPNDSRIEVSYEGSWYMPNSKTIYYWKNHKLIPYKEVEVGLKIADMKHQARYIVYSENLNLDKDSVQLSYKKSYRGKKLHDFYDSFFENN